MEGFSLLRIILVKVLNQNKLKEVYGPYRPTLSKTVGDLQWRFPHGPVAVNVFVAVINPNGSDTCPFYANTETPSTVSNICHTLHPPTPTPLAKPRFFKALSVFQLLFQMLTFFGELFSQKLIILGYRYNMKMKCRLFSFLLSQPKMGIY